MATSGRVCRGSDRNGAGVGGARSAIPAFMWLHLKHRLKGCLEVPDAEPQLRKNSLGLPDLVFHAVTHIAPTTSVVFIFPGIALQAGPAMPLSFLLTTVVCMFVGSTVFQFSKYVPSSGGYYSFATRGLGRSSGFMATWSYLIYEIIGAAAAVGFLGFLLSDTFKVEFHINISWWIIASVTTALI